jgi:hypothetical protein
MVKAKIVVFLAHSATEKSLCNLTHMPQFESARMYRNCQNFLAQQIISLKTVMLLCALKGVLRATIKGKIYEVIKLHTYYLQYIGNYHTKFH